MDKAELELGRREMQEDALSAAALLCQETFKNFDDGSNAVAVRMAQVGDRIIYMKVGAEDNVDAEEDVLEVLLTKKNDVIAKALTNVNGFVIGNKYRVPIKYVSCLPTPAEQGGGYTLHSKKVAEVKVESTRAPRVKAALEGGITKIQRCRELFAANSQLDKPAMIALFISEAKCTPQGANTYYITCKKS